MNTFSCPSCGQPIFFDNVRCLACDSELAFVPSHRSMVSLEPCPDVTTIPVQRETIFLARPSGGDPACLRVRRCANSLEHGVCNWVIPEEEEATYCLACRLNLVIPNLGSPAARAWWARLEAAKRRLLYTLLSLGLPVVSRHDDPTTGLGFAFKEDQPGETVITGHANGVITINLREADDAERERRRASLGEKYRTLAGHFRHESGHYYWLRFSREASWTTAFRRLFGDERTDYAAALARYHASGPPTGWSETHISAYATAHPWEDWAETWAHYLHLTDTLETARSHGLVLPSRAGATGDHPSQPNDAEFSSLLSSWMELTPVLNELNRGMGLPDLYPFAVSPAAREKLAFVHETIRAPAAPTAAGISATA